MSTTAPSGLFMRLSSKGFETEVANVAWRDGQADLEIVPSDGGPARHLTTHSSDDVAPVWSPDGESIFFASWRSGSWQVWQQSLVDDTGRIEPLADLDPEHCVRLDVAPDLSWMVFARVDHGGSDLAHARLRSSDYRR